MSNFAKVVRIPEPRKESFDINALLKSIIPVAEAFTMEKEIGWKWTLGEGPFIISADRHQLEQVLINVIKNAVESIDNRGEVVIVLDQEHHSLSVIDNGKGISPEDNSKIFTPFFSTKKYGQGIGLTL